MPRGTSLSKKWASLPPLPDVDVTRTPDSSVHTRLSLRSIHSQNSIMRVPTLDESLHSAPIPKTRRSTTLKEAQRPDDLDSGIKFGNVEIREYEVVIGDNPSVTFGPPISLGWGYDAESMKRVPLEDYEKTRGPRRDAKQMVIPKAVRTALLEEHGVLKRDIARSMRAVNRVKNKRTQTVNNMDTARLEEAIQSAFRKLKRKILGRKRESVEWAEWKKELEAIQWAQYLEYVEKLGIQEICINLDHREEDESTLNLGDENSLWEMGSPIIAQEDDDDDPFNVQAEQQTVDTNDQTKPHVDSTIQEQRPKDNINIVNGDTINDKIPLDRDKNDKCTDTHNEAKEVIIPNVDKPSVEDMPTEQTICTVEDEKKDDPDKIDHSRSNVALDGKAPKTIVPERYSSSSDDTGTVLCDSKEEEEIEESWHTTAEALH